MVGESSQTRGTGGAAVGGVGVWEGGGVGSDCNFRYSRVSGKIDKAERQNWTRGQKAPLV